MFSNTHCIVRTRAHARSLSQPFLQNGESLHLVEMLNTCIVSIQST